MPKISYNILFTVNKNVINFEKLIFFKLTGKYFLFSKKKKSWKFTKEYSRKNIQVYPFLFPFLGSGRYYCNSGSEEMLRAYSIVNFIRESHLVSYEFNL